MSPEHRRTAHGSQQVAAAKRRRLRDDIEVGARLLRKYDMTKEREGIGGWMLGGSGGKNGSGLNQRVKYWKGKGKGTKRRRRDGRL